MRFIRSNDIDRQQWDRCIAEAVNGLIYARSFYLDSIAAGWCALADENYDWVMPITCRKKYGISYLYQPSFTQQLGIFYRAGVRVPYKEIISYLQENYKFCEVNWNFDTPATINNMEVSIEKATNFILDLSSSYQTISSNYRSDLVKNLVRSRRFSHQYRASTDFKKCIEVYRKQYGDRMPHVKLIDYENFDKVCIIVVQKNMVICREVADENGSMMAAALLLFDGKRLYNLMNSTTSAGRKTGANHFLLDAIIKEFSGKNIVLDFEGSDLPGVKSFYENFGPVNQPYYKVSYNHLPWPLKLLKR